MPRTALLLAAMTAALLATGSTAGAKPAFRYVADGTVMTDGVRWAVIGADRDATGGLPLRAVDTRRGRALTVRSPDPTCFLHALGAGRLTWSCRGADGDRLLVTSLATGRSREARGFVSLRDRFPDATFAPVGIGRRWIEIEVSVAAWATRAFLHRRTGRLVLEGPDSRRERADLDSRRLVRRLCSPLRRRHAEMWADEYRADPVVSGSYALFDDAVLRRCGSRRGRRLTGCKGESCSPQLGAGYVTWTSAAGARAYYPRRRRAVRLGLVRGAPPVRVQHTRRHVFATGADGRTYGTRFR